MTKKEMFIRNLFRFMKDLEEKEQFSNQDH